MEKKKRKYYKEYVKEWYQRNKERLKALPHRKAAKKISDKKYYEKNKERLKEQVKKYVLKNKTKVQERRKKYYQKNKEKVRAQRATPEAMEAKKKYMKMYRQLNKAKISVQNKKKGAEWMKKQIDMVSDAYIIGRLCNKKVGIFKTHAEARNHPELPKLIELTRTKILLSRMKRKINSHDKVGGTRANKRYKNLGKRG